MAKNTTTRWDALSMRDRASLIKLYSQSGIRKLDDIRTHYNKFGEGGDKESEDYNTKLEKYHKLQSDYRNAVIARDKANNAFWDFSRTYRGDRVYWYWTDEGKRLKKEEEDADLRFWDAKKKLDAARNEIGNATLNKFTGTAYDPMYFWDFVERDRDKARKYYVERGIRQSEGAQDVINFFNSYGSSEGFNRIRENQKNWWLKRHPYRKIWQFGPKTALNATDWLQGRMKGLNNGTTDGIYDLDTYTETSVIRSGNGHGAITVGTIESQEYPYLFTLPHEIAHITNSAGFATPAGSAQAEALEQNINTQEGHDSRPSEKHSDIEALRYMLFKEGIYDSRGDRDATAEDIKKLREKYPKIRPLLQMDDEQAAWMINNVAAVNEKADMSNIAAKGGPLLHRFDTGGDTDDEYYDFLPASVVTAKLPSINTAAGKRIAKNISERVTSGKTSLSEVPDRYKSYVEGEVKGAIPVRNAINTTGVKTALGTLAVPAGIIAGAELSAASPYVWRGIDFLGNVDGLRNFFTDNGIKKTIQKYNEGDTWGTIKSGAGDLLDIIGIGDSVRMAAKLANKGYRAYHAYNTIEPYSYGDASRRFKNWAESMLFEKKYNTPIWVDGPEESKYIDLVKQETQKLNEVFDPQRRIAGIDTGKDISSKAADFARKARRDAWSLYLGRKPKYGMYTKNQDGSFSYNADKLAEYYGDNPRFGDLLKATKERKHDHIGNTHGGLWRADNSELGHVGGDSLLTRTDFGNLRIEDLWDLQPFSRQGDGPFARINELWTDKFGSQTLRNKAQSFREWMYDNGHWGEYGKKNDLLGTILKPLDRPLNIYRSGWKSKLVKDTDNLDSFIIDFKDAPVGYHWADVPIAKTADKIIDAITDNKLTRFIDNKVRNIEVGPILGGKPFMMKTDIPYTSKIMFNQTKGLDPLENTMGVETVFGKIIPEGYLDPTLYKSVELKNFLNETKNFNFNNITTKDLLTPLAYGGSIHIKPENRGKFNALLKRTGKSASWFKEHGTPLQRKRATFALNARKWKHPDGGEINVLGNPSYNKAQEEYMYRYLKDSGMDDTHVAAIMGNIAVESGLNADKKQIKGPAWGLIQAEGSRQEAIKNYNDVPYLFGSKLSPEEQRQLDYIIEKGIRTYTPGEWGMEGFKGARQARKGFINETDLTKATDIFMRNYERPSKQHRSWRQNMSKYYYDKYKEPEYYVPLDFFNK